jgi:excinuclease ABC subunit C
MTDIVKTERMSKRLLDLQEKANSLPTKPGCYLMKSKEGVVLYVGKAKSLRSRVGSYFNQSAKNAKTEILVSHIHDFDFVMTDSETEAFVLENNLIKKHGPKYNIRMRDDKSYPYVVIDRREPFPRLIYARRVERGPGREVFGPFVMGSNVSEVLRITMKSFLLRDCSLREFQSRKEPCLLYQIKQCSAPCVGKIEELSYEEALDLASDIFRGKGKKSIQFLQKRMTDLAEKEEFEQAAILRDNLQKLATFVEFSSQKNAELSGGEGDVDIIAYHVGDIEVDISLYMVRGHMLLGQKSFHFPIADCEQELFEELENFIFQYYLSSHDTLPKLVVGNFVSEQFIEALKREFKIAAVKSHKRLATLLKLTEDHARESQRVRSLGEESVYTGLGKLGELLGLKERPRILECYDIAIFQGTSPTASQIVFVEGRPEKSRYRHYHLEVRPEGNNDFAMMKEVITRRVKAGDLPDVFIVDGGKGQLSSFKQALNEAGFDIPVVGIAKEKAKSSFQSSKVERSEERLYLHGRQNPFSLSRSKALFKIIVQMRDEAHRFSRRLHHKEEKKRVFSSWIDQVEGVGPVLKEQILLRLDKTPQELAELEVDELMETLGVSAKIAENILKVIG